MCQAAGCMDLVQLQYVDRGFDPVGGLSLDLEFGIAASHQEIERIHLIIDDRAFSFTRSLRNGCRCKFYC